MKKVNCGLLTLKISKIVIYQFWYDQVKPKNKKKNDMDTWIQTP